MTRHREIYATTEDGGVQLAASADRWYVYDDYVHLSPHHAEGQLLKFDAEPLVDNPDRCALVKNCWGFVTDTERFATAEPFEC